MQCARDVVDATPTYAFGAHRGADLKLHPQAVGLITLGPSITKNKVGADCWVQVRCLQAMPHNMACACVYHIIMLHSMH